MATRNINPRSLENLKLGSESRRQGKIPMNLTVLPETSIWLKKRGSASATVDGLVRLAKAGQLKPEVDVTHHNTNQQNQLDQIAKLKEELAAAQTNLAKLQPVAISPEAIALLKDALHLKANAGGAIKENIRKALLLLGDSDERNNF